MDQWTPQKRLVSTYSSAFRRRRGFHRIGVGIAGAIIATGLAFIGAAVIRLPSGNGLIVNRDPRESIARCRRSDVHQAGSSTAPTTVVPRAW